MGAFDISRNTFNPAKHFTSVRMQQGRVLTDDDWNENERIDNEGRRRVITDVVGPYGSPDKGFKIINLEWTPDSVDFEIEPGALYLGGLRLEMEFASPAGGGTRETFLTQRDWVNQPIDEYLPPTLFDLQDGPRYDMVYLEAWQQGVSAVEDNEMFEPGLAGPDTTTRMRNMRRVKVMTNMEWPECHLAWTEAVQRWQAENLGTVNAKHERIVNTNMTVGFTTTGTGDDLCAPVIGGGYLGAENQAIRVQLVDADHFCWGFDNAAPYYRVKAINSTTVELLDLPKDQHHWMLGGTIIEFLEWSAVLPNGQKIAEIMGHLARVTGSYNPVTHQLTFSTPLDLNAFNQNYQERPDAAFLDQGGAQVHFYMRVWDRGSDTMSPASIQILGPTDLGNTGLQVRFTGSDRVPGDFWIIAARPETPKEVMPWQLSGNGMAPFGNRRFLAPLCMIKWSLPEFSENIEVEIIHDCRKTFRPLTDQETCCTFHVGNGKCSFGDYDDLAEALANLPESGGKICLLPGNHHANVEINYRHDITICGCGDRSVLLATSDDVEKPLISIAHSQNITIENISFLAKRGRAIFLADNNQPPGDSSNSITIRNNFIATAVDGIYIHTDHTSAGDKSIYIGHNTIAVANMETGGVGIYCLADGVVIERNQVYVVPEPSDDVWDEVDDLPVPESSPCDTTEDEEEAGDIFYIELVWFWIHNIFGTNWTNTRLSLGGIQIGSTSERVKIRENTIVSGAGNGITLGHLPTDLESRYTPLTFITRWDEIHRAALLAGDLDLNTFSPEELAVFPNFLHTTLDDITIERNEIRDMGMAGVGTVCFFIQTPALEDYVWLVQDLVLRENTILGCAQQIPATTRETMYIGYGGVVVASLERGVILDNVIKDNGKNSAEPICGIYVMSGDKFEIGRNRILNNGPDPNHGLMEGETPVNLPTRQGSRGGIFIANVLKTDGLDIYLAELHSDGIPAAKIYDNTVVQPLGQALFMICIGPVSVVDNNFTSQDQDELNQLSVDAGAVYILNLGVSKDLIRLQFEPTLTQLANIPTSLLSENNLVYTIGLMLLDYHYMPSGQVMFNDNQVTFDQRNLENDETLSSVSIFTTDDISFCSNQLECLGLATLLDTELGTLTVPRDRCMTDALLVGMSLRTADNRFQEGFTRTTWSLVSSAVINTTTGNQSTYCLLTYGDQTFFANNIEGIFQNYDCDNTRTDLGRVTGFMPYGS